MLLTAPILGPLLRSDDPATIRIAIDALEPVLLKHDGNLLQIAKATGIAHRTLARWLEVPEFRRAVAQARRIASVA